MTRVLVSILVAATIFAVLPQQGFAQQLSKDQRDVAVYRGIEAIKARQFSNAVREFTALINNEPSNGEYYALRGSAYYDSKDFPKAKQDFQNAINRKYNKHLIHEQLNNAESRIIMGGKSYPNGTVGELAERATSALRGGDYATAIGSSTLLIDDAKLPAKVHQAGYMLRAETFLKMGRKANARVDAQSVINSGLDVPQSRDLLKRTSE